MAEIRSGYSEVVLLTAGDLGGGAMAGFWPDLVGVVVFAI
jgi:hypothetical protein